HQGAPVPIQPKVFAALAELVAAYPRALHHDELIERLWPDESVTHASLRRCIRELRALWTRFDGLDPIGSLRGYGYRFDRAVSIVQSPKESLSDRGERNPTRRSSAANDPFVGREASMRPALAMLGVAQSGNGALLLLSGEAGIGKTRMAEELVIHGRRLGFDALKGEWHESEGAPAYWTWSHLLRELAEMRDEEDRQGPILRALTELRDSRSGDSETAGKAARFQLVDAVIDCLRLASRRRPLIIVLENLHLADRRSLRLLVFLARALHRMPLLTVATFRPFDMQRDPDRAAILRELVGDARCREVSLAGLERADIAALVQGICGREINPDLIAALHRATSGNPLFLGETTRLLSELNRLETVQDLRNLAIELPEGVRSAVFRRLSFVSDSCRQFLEAGSVLGKTFSLRMAAELVDKPLDSIFASVDEAQANRLLRGVPERNGDYTFWHDVIRRTLYENLPRSKRTSHHRRAAIRLESWKEHNQSPRLAEVAHHYEQAGSTSDLHKSIDYSERAAREALRVFAYDEAAACYQRSLDLLDLLGVEDEEYLCELSLALAESRSLAGERKSAEDAYLRAAEVARRRSRPDLLARAALGFGWHADEGPLIGDEQRRLVDEASSRLGDDQPKLKSLLLCRLATTPTARTPEEARSIGRQALVLARNSGEPLVLANALAARASTFNGPGDAAMREEIRAELDVLSEQSSLAEVQLQAASLRTALAIQKGEIETALSESERYRKLAADAHRDVHGLFALWHRVGFSLASGEFEAAGRSIGQGLELGTRLGYPQARQVAATQVYLLVKLRGGFENVDSRMALPFRHLVERAPNARLHFARAYADVGREEESRLIFENFQAEDLRSLPRNQWWMLAAAQLAELCVHFDDEMRAEVAYELLAPYASQNVYHPHIRIYLGPAAHYLGTLCRVLKRPKSARAHFESALQLTQPMQSPVFRARAQVELAEELLREPDEEVKGRGLVLLDRAERLAAGRSMTWLTNRIDQIRL
ncbi:AAA family ATPase, partial [Myxococcota bacterium]|nr:AAA family ATPase [Myxococcota bacterium]